jgi:hypothetical protein
MCNAIKWSFTAAYLFLLGMGTRGLLSDFSGWVLITLGLPWTLFLDSLGSVDSFRRVSPAVLMMLAPAINLAILFSICSTLRRRRTLPKADPLAPDLREP